MRDPLTWEVDKMSHELAVLLGIILPFGAQEASGPAGRPRGQLVLVGGPGSWALLRSSMLRRPGLAGSRVGALW